MWAGGLYLNTYVQTAALPGLKRRRAIALNLSGSGVANVLPFGGAGGIGLNYAMLRSWGYDRMRVTTYTVISQSVVAVMKVLIALGGVLALAASPTARQVIPHATLTIRVTAVVVGTGFVVALFLAFRRRRHRRFAATGEAALRETASTDQFRGRVHVWLGHTRGVLRRQWPAVTVGAFGYAALQLLLLEMCLDATTAQLSFAAVCAGFAVDRLLTLLPITPGGAGVVEAGVTAVLVALGGDPVGVAAGVLLFRGFSFFIEIPLGGAVALGWLGLRRFAAASPQR